MAEPKYRYFLVPPKTVELSAGDIARVLPSGAWTGGEPDKSRRISLPGAEVLATNVPRVRFQRLQELMPACVRDIPAAPEWIPLPVDALAQAYLPVIERELLPEPPAPAPPSPEPEAPKDPEEKKSGASAEAAPDPGEKEPEARAADPEKPKPIPAWRRLLKPTLAPPPEKKNAEEEKPPAPVPIGKRLLAAEDQARLRGLFMTDDELTVGKAVDFCGQLPSVTQCELATEDGVLHSATPRKPSASQWLSIAREALEKLAEAAPLSPVVTLYPESGAVSMWLQKEFAVIVAHDERGFPPGVREKILAVVGAIERAIR